MASLDESSSNYIRHNCNCTQSRYFRESISAATPPHSTLSSQNRKVGLKGAGEPDATPNPHNRSYLNSPILELFETEADIAFAGSILASGEFLISCEHGRLKELLITLQIGFPEENSDKVDCSVRLAIGILANHRSISQISNNYNILGCGAGRAT